MDIRVSGHQIETGEALQTHVETRLTAIADKYFSKALSASATFNRAPHDRFSCDIVKHVMQGLVLKGRAEAADAHIAFDSAADKIEKQLRRYMRRLQDRHSQTSHALREEEAAYTVFDAGDVEADAPPPDAPVIVAEMRVELAGIIWFTAAKMARSGGLNRNPDPEFGHWCHSFFFLFRRLEFAFWPKAKGNG